MFKVHTIKAKDNKVLAKFKEIKGFKTLFTFRSEWLGHFLANHFPAIRFIFSSASYVKGYRFFRG
jgi:hypothetical protein